MEDKECFSEVGLCELILIWTPCLFTLLSLVLLGISHGQELGPWVWTLV
jgi:hypothetical protein